MCFLRREAVAKRGHQEKRSHHVLHVLQHLPILEDPPEPLLSLLQVRDFRTNIRGYNCALAFTAREELRWRWSIHVSCPWGSVSPHRNSPSEAGRAPNLLPALHLRHRMRIGKSSCPTARARQRRSSCSPGNDAWHNPFIEHFRHAAEQTEASKLLLTFPSSRVPEPAQSHSDRHPRNAPLASEVAAIIPAGPSTECRDVIIFPRQTDSSPFCRISELSPFYDPLHYVLLFSRGDPGWHPGINVDDRQMEAGDRRGIRDRDALLFSQVRFRDRAHMLSSLLLNLDYQYLPTVTTGFCNLFFAE